MVFRKIVSSALVAFLFVFLLTPAASAAGAPPDLSAEAAALIDVQSGRILYAKEGDKKMLIASLTKIMTAIVAIENGNLQDVVKVPKSAVGVEGSSIYLKEGEHLTLEELLYGLMLRSGNDAAVAIAEHVGGSVQGFVYLMNEKAAMIGMTNTQFTNPHGLDDSNMHYSTAVDMAKLSAYALKNETFQKIVSTKVKTISNEGQEWKRRLLNKNKLLHMYKGADGIKTGYTKRAKRCLASSATRDGRQLAAITLDASNDWNDHARLLDWGFRQFQPVKIVNKQEVIDPDVSLEKRDEDMRIVTENEFTYPLQEEEVLKIKSKVSLFDRKLTKDMAGRHLGYLHIYLDRELIGKVPLMAELSSTAAFAPPSSIKHLPWWAVMWRIIAGGIFRA